MPTDHAVAVVEQLIRRSGNSAFADQALVLNGAYQARHG
jgi:hypothetical protein